MTETEIADRAVGADRLGASYWLGAKLSGQPLAIADHAAVHLKEALASGALDAAVTGSKFVGTRDIDSRYRVTDDGIAIVPISGLLLDRGDWLGDLWGWATSYEGLTEQCRRLAKTASVKCVVLDINSGGGMVAGLYDFCAELEKLRTSKKVYALAANMAASAAYAIASVADETYVTRSGLIGSIGVISIHTSYQRFLEARGLDTTLIYRGARKADGNPYEQLSRAARSEIGASIDRAFEQFVGHVETHRQLPAEAVRSMESRVFSGAAGVEAGLADGVKSIDELLDHIRAGGRRTRRPTIKPTGGRTVSEANDTGAERPDYDKVIAAALSSLAAARPAASPEKAAVQDASAPAAAAPAAPAAAPAGGVSAERARIKDILGSEAAASRPGLAQHLALETDLDAAQCAAILGKAPEEKAAADPKQDLAGALHREMEKRGNSADIKPEASGAGSRPDFVEFAAKSA